jgi:long-subunit fatty acid transport protein
MRTVRRHVHRDIPADHARERGHGFAATPGAFATLIVLGSAPFSAHGDWSAGAEAALRRDDNGGNYSVTVGGDLGGEAFRRLTGLNNASLEGVLQLKRKWGLGAFAPWARAAVSAGRSSYDDSYRNAWDYRTTLAAGRRIDERWNLWIEYAFDDRAATPQARVEPELSGDAYSQTSHSIAVNVEYSLNESAFLAVGLSGRRGDVVSTASESDAVYDVSRALAEDPAFGPDAYAYKLAGTTFGFRLGINFSPTAHSLLGLGFERFNTRVGGGNNYAKSVVQITWNYLL